MRVAALFRRVTDPLLTRVRIPVMGGVNQGQWWSLASAGSGHGSGRRAAEQMRLIAGLVRVGDVVWDVGAHHGFATLCLSRRVGPNGVVHAFEPSAASRALLERHVRWNDLANVKVHEFALGAFDRRSASDRSGIPETVEVRTGASLIAQGICRPPTFVRIDVDGAEGDAIAGALGALPSSVRVLVAMHGPASDARCRALLLDAGFELVPSTALEESRAGEWRSDPDLYAIGPDGAASERHLALLREAGFMVGSNPVGQGDAAASQGEGRPARTR